MSRSMSFPTLLVFVIVLVLSVPSFGQKDTGSIVGTVKDPTGALVTNAKVTVTDAERGPALTTTTNDAGEYVAGPLRVGRYTVTDLSRQFLCPSISTCRSESRSM